MSQQTISPVDQMMQFILGNWISKPIYVATKLGIADILAGGARSIDEIAEKTETHSPTLYRLMRALSGLGIFAETEDRVFVNTPLSECLQENRLRAASLLFHSDWHDRMWDHLLYSIKTGRPAFDKVHGKPAFEWFADHAEEAKVFHDANSFKAAMSHRVIVDVYDFTGIKELTDVGGGLGGLMMETLRANPTMRGIVAELPETARRVGAIVEDSELADRMTAVECDFFEEVPAGSDAYLLSHVLHDWSDERCVRILRNCRKAMGTDGRLLIVEAVIPTGNAFSVSKLLDLEVLLMGGGRERSEEEFRWLLEESGFRLSRILPSDGDVSIIEGIPE